MSVLSGYGKYKRYVLTSTGYKLCSQWTSSNTVHFDDGKTAQAKLGAISGITDSLTATSSNVALSAKAGKSLQDQVTKLNTGIANIGAIRSSNFYSGEITDFSFVPETITLPPGTWLLSASGYVIYNGNYQPYGIGFNTGRATVGMPPIWMVTITECKTIYLWNIMNATVNVTDMVIWAMSINV